MWLRSTDDTFSSCHGCKRKKPFKKLWLLPPRLHRLVNKFQHKLPKYWQIVISSISACQRERRNKFNYPVTLSPISLPNENRREHQPRSQTVYSRHAKGRLAAIHFRLIQFDRFSVHICNLRCRVLRETSNSPTWIPHVFQHGCLAQTVES